MQKFRRWVAALSCLVVAAASFALSYVALRDVAASIGAVPAHLAWLVPIVIDGGIMCGSAVIWSASKEDGRRPVFPFLFVASMVSISVVVNASHASDALLAKVIAAMPPLILLGTLELVASQGRKLASSSDATIAAAKSTLTPAAPVQRDPQVVSAAQTKPADTLDFELLDDIEDALTPARPDWQKAEARSSTPRPPRASASSSKRSTRVQASQADDLL